LPKIYCQQGARRPGDIISDRRATSSRNQRATSSESALRPRSARNSNIARRHNDEFAGRQLVSVVLQRLIQMLYLRLQLGPGKPEKQDAGVGKALVKDQLTEIAVGNDEDPLLLPGNRQHVLIGKTGRVVSRDGRDVVIVASKVVDKAKIGALVKEEFHTSGAERAPLGGFGETSSPVTIAFA
jgi:hypothetical protein